MLFLYETPRLVLKILKPDAADAVLDFYNRDKALFEKYEMDRVPDFYTIKHQQKMLRYEYNSAFKSQLFRYYVFTKENPNQIIGTICIHNISPSFYGSCEIGYKFSSQFHHKGFAHEAVGFCTMLAFDELKLHKVTAIASPHNFASLKLLSRLGFLQEGLLRDYLFLHGKWCDHYLLGLLREDFTYSFNGQNQ